MKYLVKGNKVLAAILSLVVILGAAIPVNAASADVNIEIKATDMNMSVTVPSTLPVVFNEDGTNTLPSTWKIQNNSTIAGICLVKVDMDGSENGWKLLPESSDTKTMAKNTKSIKFFVGREALVKLVNPTGNAENAKGSVTFTPGEFEIPSGTQREVSFGVERGAFTTSQSSEKAFDMVMTFEFM